MSVPDRPFKRLFEGKAGSEAVAKSRCPLCTTEQQYCCTRPTSRGKRAGPNCPSAPRRANLKRRLKIRWRPRGKRARKSSNPHPSPKSAPPSVCLSPSSLRLVYNVAFMLLFVSLSVPLLLLADSDCDEVRVFLRFCSAGSFQKRQGRRRRLSRLWLRVQCLTGEVARTARAHIVSSNNGRSRLPALIANRRADLALCAASR